MARKGDPFNFDDVYKQVGAEEFVKKSMAQQKSNQPARAQPTAAAPAPAPAPRPAVASPASRAQAPMAGAGNMDLDFLSSMAATPTSNGSPAISKPSSTANLAAQGGSTSRLGAAASDDPFAAFSDVPGAAAPVPRPAAAAAAPAAGFANLLDLDGNDGFHAPAPAPPQPAPNLPAPVPAATPVAPSPPSPPPPPYAPPQSAAHHDAPPPPYQQLHHHSEDQGFGDDAAWSSGPAATAGAGAGASGPAAVHGQGQGFRPAAPSGGAADGAAPGFSPLQDALQWRRASAGQSGGPSVPVSAAPPPPPSGDGYYFYDGMMRDRTGAPVSSSGGGGYGGGADADSSSSGGGGGSGIGGYLKAFGKRAVKVAKAGLTQLEHALESLEHGTGQTAAARRERHEEPDDPTNNDEALAWAVRLADMTPHQQEQHLAQMPRPLRHRVLEVLREQARAEVEAALQDEDRVHTTEYRPEDEDLASRLGTGDYSGYSSAAAPPSYAAPPPPPAYAQAQQHRNPSPPRGYTAEPPAPPPLSPPPPPVVHEEEDLLGIGGGDDAASSFAPGRAAPAPRSPTAQPAQAQAAPPPPPPPEDLLGLDGDSKSVRMGSAALAPNPAPAPAASVHVDDIADFFSGGAKPSTTPRPAAATSTSSAAASSAAPPKASASSPSLDMLHGLHDDVDVDTAQYKGLYEDDVGHENEPEIRKQLRAQRLAAKHGKMKAALAEKLANEQEEARRREEQVNLKEQFKANVEVWKSKNKGNIRGLLSSLQSVLWADSGWQPLSMGDLLEPNQVKKCYMKANLLVHPDKVRQRNGTAEQVAIADMVFDVLKDAWNIFR